MQIVSEMKKRVLFERNIRVNKSKMAMWGVRGSVGTCGTYGEEEQCTLYKVLAMKVEGK